VKYAWIKEHRNSFPVAVMCDVLHVSKSGYYVSLDRPQSRRSQRYDSIRRSVQQVHAESHGIYGSHMIAEVLQIWDGLESARRNTVAATMQELGLASKVVKAFKPTTTQADPSKLPAENMLDQDFTAEAPNRKWVTDITYLPTPPAGSTWPLSWTSSTARSWAGRSRPRWRRTWSAMRCEEPSRCGVPRATTLH
jgi:putative transposase